LALSIILASVPISCLPALWGSMLSTQLQEKGGSLKGSLVAMLPEPRSEPESPRVCSHCAPVMFQPGDMVDLEGPSAAPGFRNQPAVVTKVFDRHCEVVVVDSSLNCIGECWPNVTDITLRGDAGWRLHQRVYIKGLRHKHRRLLNGSTGVIIEHVQEGHPCFISRNGSEHPQLAVCVRLDEPWERKRTIVLEPKYVHSWDEELFKATSELAEVAALLKPVGKTAEPQAEPSPAEVAALLKPVGKAAEPQAEPSLVEVAALLKPVGKTAEPQAEPSPQSTPLSTFRGGDKSTPTSANGEPRTFFKSFSFTTGVRPMYMDRMHLCDVPTPRRVPAKRNRNCDFGWFFDDLFQRPRSGSRCL